MPSRSGELAMRPLPAVLLDLHDERASGQLVLKRGRVSKTVDLIDGNPVSAASTPRDETLGPFLVASGVIREEQHRQAVARSSAEGVKLGESMVALGILTRAQLDEQLLRQARHKLVQSLRWPQGAWRFDDSRAVADGRQLRMPEVVIGGLCETAIEDLERLWRFDGMSFELTARGARLRAELARAWGASVLGLLAPGASIEALEAAFEDRVQARIALDAMIACDAVTAVGSVDIGLGAAGAGEAAPRPRRAPVVASRAALLDSFFDELSGPSAAPAARAAPIEAILDEASGVVSLDEVALASADREQASAARRAIAAEHQRIQGADHYAVLKVDRKATAARVDEASQARTMEVLEHAVALGGRDRARAHELEAAYGAARAVLADPARRAAYDRELAGGESGQAPPALDTELAFRLAEEEMARGGWEAAIGHLRQVLARAPNEADYHAALGWCLWKASREDVAGADAAREHLGQALAIAPDHAAAHEYKGRVEATLRSDDAEALFLLERALDLDPRREGALAAAEALLVGKGDLRRYERLLKRLLFRLREAPDAVQGAAWKRLARLYVDHLGDRQAGRAALDSACRLAADPADPDLAALVQRATARPSLEPMDVAWGDALGDPGTGAALVTSSVARGHVDAAFLAASVMVALQTAPEAMTALYEQHRVRELALPARPLDREAWDLLRHRADTVELGNLIELLAPAIHALAPMTLADGELDGATKLDDDYLPATFAALRARLATLLGVAVAPVYARVELGRQIHVLAADPPVLLAGDEALTSGERPELVFALARAMTFLWPGRAVGASRPGRVLRAIVMAIFREASGSTIGAEEALAPRAADALAALPAPARAAARAAALRLLSRGDGLNLSLWARSLARTADRAGLLLCGDIPAALAGATEMGELDRDLQEFAYSAAHVRLRAQLGLSVG